MSSTDQPSEADPTRLQPPSGMGASDEWLRLMVESARDFAIFTIGEDLRVTSWNPGAALIFGYPEKEMLGRDSRILFTPEDRAAHQPEEEARTALQEGRAEDERWHLRKGGTRFWASGLAMPLQDRSGNVLGILKIARDLTSRKQAADSLQTTTLELNHLREQLDQHVRDRTAELVQANRHLENVIDERKRLEEAAVEATEREQRRMGQELHDGVCQQLAGISLSTTVLARSLMRDRPEIAAEITHLGEMLRETVTSVRRLSRGLHPVEVERGSLFAGLRELADIANAQVSLPSDAEDISIERTTALNLYRIAQEAVTNAMRHADAKSVEICVVAKGTFTMQVTDDGKGFEWSEVEGRAMGLELMRYRASAINAKFTLFSEPGGGTMVECSLPAGQGWRRGSSS